MRCPICEKDGNLSPREIEVLDLVIKGKTNKEIAQVLFVEEKTIKHHMTNILRKRKAQNRHQLIYETCVARLKGMK